MAEEAADAKEVEDEIEGVVVAIASVVVAEAVVEAIAVAEVAVEDSEEVAERPEAEPARIRAAETPEELAVNRAENALREEWEPGELGEESEYKEEND